MTAAIAGSSCAVENARGLSTSRQTDAQGILIHGAEVKVVSRMQKILMIRNRELLSSFESTALLCHHRPHHHSQQHGCHYRHRRHHQRHCLRHRRHHRRRHQQHYQRERIGGVVVADAIFVITQGMRLLYLGYVKVARPWIRHGVVALFAAHVALTNVVAHAECQTFGADN